jgi:hypothetical protein
MGTKRTMIAKITKTAEVDFAIIVGFVCIVRARRDSDRSGYLLNSIGDAARVF